MDSIEFLDLFLMALMFALIAYRPVICADYAAFGWQGAVNDSLDHLPYLGVLRRTTGQEVVYIFYLGKCLHGIVKPGNTNFTLWHLVCGLRHYLGRIIDGGGFKVNIIKDRLTIIKVCETGDATFTGT